MRIVLTGSSGFVGKRLAERARDAGHEVVELVRPGKPAAAGRAVAWDMGQGGPIAGLPDTADVVIHAAQSRAYRRFPEDAPEMFAVNVAATQRLLEWAAGAKVSHFVNLSSGAVYTEGSSDLSEGGPTRPSSYLGASKLAAECLVRAFAAKVPAVTLRLFFPYGPGQFDRLMPNLIQRVRAGEPLDVGSDGEGLVFTPTFVEDVCGVIEAAVAERWTGELNVAPGTAVSLRTVGETIGSIIGKPVSFRVGEKPSPRMVPDVAALGRRYDPNRFRSIREGLEATLAAG